MLEELITITKFLSLGEAKLAQGKLVSAGIAAFVCDENMHAMNWHMGMALGGIRLQVPDSLVYGAEALSMLINFISIAVYSVRYWPALRAELRLPGGDAD